MLPADPWQELQAISLMSWCSGGIHPFLARINSPPRVCDAPGTDESVKKLAAANLMELFKIADNLLAGREFSSTTSPRPMRISSGVSDEGGNSTSICQSSDIARTHFERMMQRPSVQKLLAFEKSVQADFAKAA